MKFETKFGLGEIVATKQQEVGRQFPDNLFKVISIQIGVDGGIAYLCRVPSGYIVAFAECELVGDPDFDQATGYPPPA